MRTAATFCLVVLGPVLALVTYLVMGPLDQGASSNILRIVLLCDLVYVMSEGRISGEFRRKEATAEKLLEHALLREV